MTLVNIPPSNLTLNTPDFDVVRQQPAVDGLGGVRHEGPSFEASLLQEPGKSSTVVQVEAERRTNQRFIQSDQNREDPAGFGSSTVHGTKPLSTVGPGKRTPETYSDVYQMKLFICSEAGFLNSLADEQQVDLSWIDQVDVGQSVHPLQTGMDPTIQLKVKKMV